MEVQEELAQNVRYLARQLHYPDNLGVEMRGLSLGTGTPTPALLAWTDGLTDPFSPRAGVVESLGRITGPPAPGSLPLPLVALSPEWTTSLDVVVTAIFQGRMALLVQGWQGALLLDAMQDPVHPNNKPSDNPNRDILGSDIKLNVALIRKRLRTARLLALRLPVHESVGGAALLHVDGTAYPPLVRLLTRQFQGRLSEGQVLRGELAGRIALYGFMPRFMPLNWPDDIALLLDRGYVVLLLDRVSFAYAAPVTVAGMLSLGENMPFRMPLHQHLARGRILLLLGVMLLPGSVVALLNYHQEMLPTGLLLSVATTRENAPFGVFFEVLFLETLVEVGREATFRLPQLIPMTAVLVTLTLTILLSVQVGFVSSLPALAAVVGSLVSLTAPSYTAGYVTRIWRFYFLLAGVLLGFFGIATVLAIFLTYLCQASSWGVPVMGPSGPKFTSGEGPSSRPTFTGGRKNGAKAKRQVW